MARKKYWIKKAIKRPGALRRKAKRAGALKDGISVAWLKKQAKKKGRKGTPAQARLALRLRKMRKRGRKRRRK